MSSVPTVSSAGFSSPSPVPGPGSGIPPEDNNPARRPQPGGAGSNPPGLDGEGRRSAEARARQAAGTPEAARDEDAQSGRVQEQIQKLRQELGFKLNFKMDRDLDRVIVKVMNPETEEVIRQVPPEEMLAMAREWQEAKDGEPAGLLMDEYR